MSLFVCLGRENRPCFHQGAMPCSSCRLWRSHDLMRNDGEEWLVKHDGKIWRKMLGNSMIQWRNMVENSGKSGKDGEKHWKTMVENGLNILQMLEMVELR